MINECTMMSGILGSVMPIALMLLLVMSIAALGKYLFTSTKPTTGANS